MEASKVTSTQNQNQESLPAEPILHFRAEENPKVTVIITGWRSAPLLMDCLRTLETGKGSVSYEVIVSLNEPTESLLTSLERGVTGASVISSSYNLGFGGACNRAAAKARGEFIVLLNDDAVVLDGWLEALVEAAEQNRDAGAVGSRMVFEDGRVQEEGAVIWSDGGVTQIDSEIREEPFGAPRLRRVDYCSAASLLVRRSTWESLGGMSDDYFPAYYEDVDFCMKIAALGQKVLYQPKSTVVHRHGTSTTHRYRSFLLERNKKRFVANWAAALALHEPPEPGCRDAVARAARLAESRTSPAPVTPTDLRSRPNVKKDAEYPKRELELYAEYASQLETTVASAESTNEQLVSQVEGLVSQVEGLAAQIENLEGERVQLHHDANELQTQVEFYRARDHEARHDLASVLSRRRYLMIDRLYNTANSVPGFQRALQWVLPSRVRTD
ncbi:MAG: glycosyltransferase family 2 protein [Acidimicrobiales bacterium]